MGSAQENRFQAIIQAKHSQTSPNQPHQGSFFEAGWLFALLTAFHDLSESGETTNRIKIKNKLKTSQEKGAFPTNWDTGGNSRYLPISWPKTMIPAAGNPSSIKVRINSFIQRVCCKGSTCSLENGVENNAVKNRQSSLQRLSEF